MCALKKNLFLSVSGTRTYPRDKPSLKKEKSTSNFLNEHLLVLIKSILLRP